MQSECLLGVHEQGGVAVAEVEARAVGDDMGERRGHLMHNAFGVLGGERQLAQGSSWPAPTATA